MTIRKKRLLSLIIACAWFVTMQAQHVFTANLDVSKMAVGTTLDTNLEEFQNWDMEECVVGEKESSWNVYSFQVNVGGHVTTSSFSVNVPKIRAVFYARAVDTDSMQITLSATVNDKTSTQDYKLKSSWRSYAYIIDDVSNPSNIKLRFEAKDGNDYPFQLYKLTIESHLFYESFNNMNASIDNNANIFAGNNFNAFPASTSKLDNNNASINAKEAKNCIFINNTESYITPQISELDRTPVVLAFRAAGDSENPATIDLTSNSNCTLGKSSFTPTASTWTTYRVPIVIKNFNSNCQITFAGKNYFLDDVKIYYPSTIPLDEASNNSSIINDQSNEVVNAALTRTLTGGTWNTLCLPFAINQNMLTEAVGSYNETQFRILYKVEDNTFKFKSTETVPAGTPCLVKPTTTVTNPTFKGVTIEATVPTKTTSNGYGLYGTFSPIELATDHTNAFLSSDQRLYYPGAGQNTMNGMRAYFVLPSQAQNARVQIGENSEQNGIKETCDTDNSQAVYDLSGRKMRPSTLQKGIYIINGKKTIIR